MAILPILRWPDVRLCTPCTPVDGDVRTLAADMLETMYAAPGRGLAAPQVGHLLRLFVMDTTWKEGRKTPRVVINPEMLWRSDQIATGPEGCLSIPGVTADVTRPVAVRMRWTDLGGQSHDEVLTSFDAVCAQHEFDHLDGLVTFDRVAPDLRASLQAGYVV